MSQGIKREAASEGPSVVHIDFCNLSKNSMQQLGAAAQKPYIAEKRRNKTNI